MKPADDVYTPSIKDSGRTDWLSPLEHASEKRSPIANKLTTRCSTPGRPEVRKHRAASHHDTHTRSPEVRKRWLLRLGRLCGEHLSLLVGGCMVQDLQDLCKRFWGVNIL